MHKIYSTYKPKGFSTISLYLMVKNAKDYLAFLKSAFFAEEKQMSLDPENGEIRNCILQIGDACFMLSEARPPFEDMKSTYYLYTNDVDALHKNAIENGAIEYFPPQNMPYEDRQSGLIDKVGNYWWISQRLVEEDYK